MENSQTDNNDKKYYDNNYYYKKYYDINNINIPKQTININDKTKLDIQIK